METGEVSGRMEDSKQMRMKKDDGKNVGGQ